MNYVLLINKHKIKQCTYEPRLNRSSNPEARIELKDGAIIDIEVKTPGFHDTNRRPKKARIKPNLILDNNVKTQIIEYCKINELELVYPRVLKLKEFIRSAASKFVVPTTKRHFNLLFINWTYTDFPECELAEPITILANPINGILTNKKAHGLVGIKNQHIEKISAVVLYKDSMSNILFGDFTYHFQDKSYELLINQANQQYIKNTEEDEKYLEELLNMEIYNNQSLITWWLLMGNGGM